MEAHSHRRLEGRRALVTGGGSGNGAAIARRLLEDGATVLVLDVNSEHLDTTLNSWPEPLRKSAESVVADVTSTAEIERVFGDLEGLDILVNNAGIVRPSAFPELDVDEFLQVLDVNLLGAYRCTKA